MSFDDDPFLRKFLVDTRILAPKHKEGLACECKNNAETVRISFCRESCCPNLDEARTQCKKHKKPIGRLDLRPKHTTLRNRGTSSGWYYRNI
jgi:hypothetical protein